MSNIEGAILSSFRAGIVAIRADGTVAYINPIGAKILEGCPLREGENIHPRAAENVFFRVLSESLTMNYLPARVEAELPGRDGERQSLGFTLAVLKEMDGTAGICAYFKDLTHVEMAEESENLKERLMMLGQMAAGLAHEIRNPIASIGVHASILRSNLSGNEKLLSSVNMMSREIEKVDYIIRECLNFVRPAELDLRQIRVDKLLESVIARMIALHPEMTISLKTAANGELKVDADAALLDQVVTNLLANAADACHGKGTVTIHVGTSRHFTDAVRLNRQFGTILPDHSGKEEDFVRIHIRDNGPGISPEIQERIFAPFFTTKKAGTGIGLPLAQKIIFAHGGVLDMNSDVGKGTEFIIKIPMRQTVADRILIVEDNEALRVGIRLSLEDAGYAVQEAATGEDAVRKLENEPCHVVITDIRLGDLSGVDILKKAKEVNSEIEVILMTAYATVETAVQALRLGAYDYIQKPFDMDQLQHRVKTALRLGKMRGELEFYRKAEYRNAIEGEALVAESRGLKEILSVIRKVAPTPATILITGETGTGKELLATLVHFGSPRAKGPFIKVNCAALHENLLESELFGHERGAFTGAEKLRIGRFEQADKGTIFLDEIGDMSATTQAKVLRVLQEQEFERLGSSGKSVKVDVRVVTATNKDLRVEVKEGRFRQDLYFRLNVVNLFIPPLRERLDDILPLARFFLNKYAVDFKKKVTGFSPEAIEKIRHYPWPGNVRELQNSIERAVLLCDEETIDAHNLTLEGRSQGDSVMAGDTLNLEDLERGAIERALRATRGVQKEAADLLGVTPRVLNYKIQLLKIDWKSFRV